MAVATLISGIVSAGLTVVVLAKILDNIFINWGEVFQRLLPGSSVNGHFEFTQEVNSTYTKARNKNRILYIRFGYRNNFTVHNFGDGAWFEIAR